MCLGSLLRSVGMDRTNVLKCCLVLIHPSSWPFSLCQCCPIHSILAGYANCMSRKWPSLIRRSHGHETESSGPHFGCRWLKILLSSRSFCVVRVILRNDMRTAEEILGTLLKPLHRSTLTRINYMTSVHNFPHKRICGDKVLRQKWYRFNTQVDLAPKSH